MFTPQASRKKKQLLRLYFMKMLQPRHRNRRPQRHAVHREGCEARIAPSPVHGLRAAILSFQAQASDGQLGHTVGRPSLTLNPKSRAALAAPSLAIKASTAGIRQSVCIQGAGVVCPGVAESELKKTCRTRIIAKGDDDGAGGGDDMNNICRGATA